MASVRSEAILSAQLIVGLFLFRYSLQDSVTVNGLLIEFRQMYVADVATTRAVRTTTRFQDVPQVVFIQISDHFLDEVASPNLALSINGNHRFPRVAVLPQ